MQTTNFRRRQVHTNGSGSAAHATHWHASPETREHLVQFYDTDDFLNDRVATYLAEGFSRSQPMVVIATEQRIDSVQWRLASRGFDVDRAHRRGDLILLNAHDALATFMVAGMPEVRRFQESMGRLIERSRRGRSRTTVRAYGEMVDVLWREGNREAALRLEELWNGLASQYSFALLCAYAMGHFHRESDELAFKGICEAHEQILPAETYDATADERTRARQVGLLQQRARALEHEIDERKKFERALKDALAERLRAEDALRAMKERAERASSAKSQFLAVMSHELRTPLNAIIGYQDLLAHEVGGPLNENQRGYVTRIRSASEQLLKLIEQILSLSRIDAGKEELRLERVDVTSVASETVSMIEPAAVGKGLTVKLSAPGVPIECVSDSGKLKQILMNLLSNAVKFTDRGSVEVEVAPTPHSVAIRVRDTGPGVPEREQARIFEPFVMADGSSTRRHGGTGLGLPVSRELARLLGGEVFIENMTAEGSTFTLELPTGTDATESA